MYRIRLFLILLLCAASPFAQADVCHVDTAGGGDGASWASPLSLQTALATPGCTQIWVKHGSYKAHPSNRTVSFVVPPGVALYGGFAGTETALAQRVLLRARRSVLTGDLAGNDCTFIGTCEDGIPVRTASGGADAENTQTLVLMYGASGEDGRVLDGFTLAGATGGSGALTCYVGTDGQTCSPQLRNLVFSGNGASDWGSAVAVNVAASATTPSRPQLANVGFRGNWADRGVVSFIAESGARIEAELSNVSFAANYMNGGICDPGVEGDFYSCSAIYSNARDSTLALALRHVTAFRNVDATNISPISVPSLAFDAQSSGNIAVSIANSVLWSAVGVEEFHNPGVPSLTIVASQIQFCSAAVCGFEATPPDLGPLGYNGGSVPGLLPNRGSALIDAGDAAACLATDQRGQPRDAACDVGALEVQGARRCHVGADVLGNDGGGDWASAYTDLQRALRDASCTEVFVKRGTYKPVVPADTAQVTDAERNTSFTLVPGVALYGGFAGTETDLAQRVLSPGNRSVLSGDLDGDDCATASLCEGGVRVVPFVGTVDNTTANTAGNEQNTRLLVSLPAALGADVRAIDGFTLTSAVGDVEGDFTNASALRCVAQAAGQRCAPNLRNLVVSGNGYRASINSFVPTLLVSAADGGTAQPYLSGISFRGNLATDGVVHLQALPGGSFGSTVLENVSFFANRTIYSNQYTGMATLSNGGGVLPVTLRHVTSFGNRPAGTVSAATLRTLAGEGNTTVEVANSLFWGSQSSGTGEINHNSIDPGPTLSVSVKNSLVRYSGGSGVGNWDEAIGTDYGGNLDADPGTPVGGEFGGVGYSLLFPLTSNIVDAGSGDAGDFVDIDQRGVARPQGAGYDLGSVELTEDDAYCFVRASATGAATGKSWEDAWPDLQTALTQPAACKQVRVAAGVYKPGAARSVFFGIQASVKVYGGYPAAGGDEDERDWRANPTVLSGDIDNDDCGGSACAGGVTPTAAQADAGNSDRVAVLYGNALIDGFTITGAHYDTTEGAGLLLASNGSKAFNVRVVGNYGQVGGGVRITGVGSQLIGATVENNTAAGANGGGGIFQGVASTNVLVQDSTIVNNATLANFSRGAGIASESGNLTVVNSTISGNATGGNNTGGGGISKQNSGNLTLAYVTVLGNSSFRGGGVSLVNTVNLRLYGSAIANNTAYSAAYGPDCRAGGATPTVVDSWVETTQEDGCVATANGDIALGALADNGGPTQTHLPPLASPLLDAIADCTSIETAAGLTLSTDQRGYPRASEGCDIGAVERRAPFRITVNVSGDGEVDGPASTLGDAIADCRADSGDCSGTFDVETNSGTIALALTTGAVAAPGRFAWHVGSTTGCGGVHSGNLLFGGTYTTAALATLASPCEVNVIFAPNIAIPQTYIGPIALTYGQDADYETFVQAQSPASGGLYGTVSFYDNGVLLATDEINNGDIADFTLIRPGAGTHVITAQYNGDIDVVPSPDRFLPEHQPVAVIATLNVARRPATATADAASKIYGDDDPASFAYSISPSTPLVPGDSLSGTLTRAAGEDAGYYGILAGSLTDANNPNYAIAFSGANAFRILPAPLIVAARDFTKPYDGVPYSGGNGVDIEGFQFDDSASDLDGEPLYGGDSQGAVDVGDYVIAPSGLTSDNYDIEFLDGELHITAPDIFDDGFEEPTP